MNESPTELPLFAVRPKGGERGWHRWVARAAVLLLSIAHLSRIRGRERWHDFYTLMPEWGGVNTWVLYVPEDARADAGTIAHENVHVRQSERLGRVGFCALYLLNPLALLLWFATGSAWWLLLLPVLNPVRGHMEWEAYRAEWAYYASEYPWFAKQWSKKLPGLLAGPAYLFASPLHALWAWWARKREAI